MGGRVEPFTDVEQQDLVELRDCLGRPVIPAHQHFADPHGQLLAFGRLAVAKGFGHGGLQVEHQAVFAPVRQDMQPGADQAQQRLVALDLFDLVGRGQAVAGQCVPGVAKPGRLGHPQNGLQVTQAAG